MFEDDIFHPQRAVQRIGDWFEQRKAYRLAALIALRKREGLPQPVDQAGVELETRFDDQGQAYYVSPDGTRVERVLFAGTGKDGKPGAFAIGQRKQDPRELADINWNNHASAEFEILDIADDGRKLSDELRDLDRDAAEVELAGSVSHGMAGEQAPGLNLVGTSDEEIDKALQEFLRRGK